MFLLSSALEDFAQPSSSPLSTLFYRNDIENHQKKERQNPCIPRNERLPICRHTVQANKNDLFIPAPPFIPTMPGFPFHAFPTFHTYPIIICALASTSFPIASSPLLCVCFLLQRFIPPARCQLSSFAMLCNPYVRPSVSYFASSCACPLLFVGSVPLMW